MSKRTEIIAIEPPSGRAGERPEIIQVEGYDCPDCGGKGYHDNGGWIGKYAKKEYSDPDYPVCERCQGSGRLKASVVIKWMPDNVM